MSFFVISFALSSYSNVFDVALYPLLIPQIGANALQRRPVESPAPQPRSVARFGPLDERGERGPGKLSMKTPKTALADDRNVEYADSPALWSGALRFRRSSKSPQHNRVF